MSVTKDDSHGMAVYSLGEKHKDVSSDQTEEAFDDDVVDLSVPAKYRGTSDDRKQMQTLGKKQVLRRNFRFATMIGFASTVVLAWEILLPAFTFVLVDGGPPILFWGEIAVMCGMLLVYASLAEMASMAPTAGGQYHWVSEFAPPKHQKFLSYTVGCLAVLGWQTFLAAVCFTLGLIAQGMIAFNDAEYPFSRWHGTLLAIAAISFAIVFNTVLGAKLPLLEGVVLIVHIAGFFAIIIPLWVMAPISPVSTALFEFQNNGGWPTTGLAAMIGMTTPLAALLGYDCSIHMAEEIHDASMTLPKSLMWGVFGNAIMAFGMAVTLVFTMGDGAALQETTYGVPFIQLFYNAVQNRAAVNVMVAVIIFLCAACCISEVACASRQLWSFARDGGMPFSEWLSVVPPGWNLPIRSVLVSFVVACLIACINIGSSTALNAINSFAQIPLITSYMVTIGTLIWRRLYGDPLPPRRWSLGRYGLGINIAAVCFLLPIWFFVFWPLATPVTPTTMNWSSLMFGGVIIFFIIWYHVKAKYTYTGPVVQVKRYD